MQEKKDAKIQAKKYPKIQAKKEFVIKENSITLVQTNKQIIWLWNEFGEKNTVCPVWH